MTHEPLSLDEACEAIRSCADAKKTIGVTGGEHPSGPARVAVDDVISLRRMSSVVEYEPSDQIVTVEAGMTIAALANVLGERAQRLALDPPGPEAATVGGCIASNAYGPLRTRYGTAKDAILGMTIVRADGTRARGGGKVVKNVAGFDIPKLMVGTYGTLAIVATVTFRVHPLPRSSVTLAVDDLDAVQVRALTSAVVKAQLEPSAIEASYDGVTYRYFVRFEGFGAGVRAQRERFAALAPSCVDVGSAANTLEEATNGDVAVKMTAPSSRLDGLHVHGIDGIYRALGEAHACVLPSVGAAFVSGKVRDAERLLPALRDARTWCESVGGTLVLQSAAPAIGLRFDAWGTPPPAFPLMRALKERFDPQRLLQPGGFVGGL
jgi:glycolate oxidase FAD binding subunit